MGESRVGRFPLSGAEREMGRAVSKMEGPQLPTTADETVAARGGSSLGGSETEPMRGSEHEGSKAKEQTL